MEWLLWLFLIIIVLVVVIWYSLPLIFWFLRGVAIRYGHHCEQVLMEKLNVAATNRASFYIYTTKEEIDALITALQNVAKVFKL